MFEHYEKLLRLNRLLAVHFMDHWASWVMGMMVLAILPSIISIRINITPSLPSKVFVIVKGMEPHRGDYVAFRWHTRFYPNNPECIKIMMGVEGDVVTSSGSELFVNHESVGLAKATSKTGIPLEMTKPRVIDKGEFYAYAPHKDSLDSRYAEVGYVQTSQIIGRAFSIF